MRIARCQSVDGHRSRTAWRASRSFVHLPYIRAVVAGLCLVAILGSVGAIAVAIYHDVSTAAVARYFLRQHSDEADLSRYFRSGITAVHLEPFLVLPAGVTPGGLVYVEQNGLTFHALTPARHQEVQNLRRRNGELFDRLTPLYLNGDLPALATELNRPAARQVLLAAGAQIQDLYALQRFESRALDLNSRTRLLRTAARQIQLVAPYIPVPFEMSFADLLRFYEGRSPAGKFVGRWEIAAPSPLGTVDADYAFEMSRTHHYIVISKFGGPMTVSDFYKGTRRDFAVEQVGDPRGRTFYRLSALPAS